MGHSDFAGVAEVIKNPGIGKGRGLRQHPETEARYLAIFEDGDWHGVTELSKRLFRWESSVTKFMGENRVLSAAVEKEYRVENGTRRIYWRLKK